MLGIAPFLIDADISSGGLPESFFVEYNIVRSMGRGHCCHHYVPTWTLLSPETKTSLVRLNPIKPPMRGRGYKPHNPLIKGI